MYEHRVQFYDDEAFIVDEIWRFIAPCHHPGEPAVVIATSARLDNLERRSSARETAGSQPGAAPYVPVDAHRVLSQLMIGDQPDDRRFQSIVGDLLRRVSEDGKRPVRVYGEMVALLCAQGNPAAAIRLEQLWNELGKEIPFSLLCGYPMHAFSKQEDAQAFCAICDAHSHVGPAENFREQSRDEVLHRTIALLQQKAKALESEVGRRKEIELALQRREQALSDFLENAPEGMHCVRPDGTIAWANKSELDLLGYARNEYVGHHIAEFHTDGDVAARILSKLLTGDALYDESATLRCRDGSVKHVLIRSHVRLIDGESAATRCIMRDVTDRVRLEETLHQKLQELAEVDRRKDEFLAMLGHELRNPLAPIMNSLELMRLYANYPEQIARSRETISRQVALLTRLVDDLLDVSRITRGKIALKMEVVALEQVIERSVEIAGPLINERHHRLSLNLPESPVRLLGDAARLAQVMANLLHNAAKYTDPGGSISLTALTDGADLVLTVRDNGIGLDKDLQERVFDLFVQDAKSLSKARGGLGLGLTLVRSLVHLHGGTVSVLSEGHGLGSAFVVRLPMHLPSQKSAEQTEEGALSNGCIAPRIILIVDDNIDAAESLGEFLKISGHDIQIAHDGPSAIEEAARIRPEVIILDIGMPGMDGYRVAQCLRSEVGLTSSLLIAVTGFAQDSDRRLAQQAGFDHHFAKPIDMARLESVLRQYRR